MRKFREFLREELAMNVVQFGIYAILFTSCIVRIFSGKESDEGSILLLSIWLCYHILSAKLNKVLGKKPENDKEKLLCKEYELKEKFTQAQHERAKDMANI